MGCLSVLSGCEDALRGEAPLKDSVKNEVN